MLNLEMQAGISSGGGLNRLGALNQSILAKASRGELVPQAPNDAPPSVLFERIWVEREAAEGERLTRKGGVREEIPNADLSD